MSDVRALDNSTGISVLVSPNYSKNNILVQYDVTYDGASTWDLTKIADHNLDETKMNTFAFS
jgi:hypothetical protein